VKTYSKPTYLLALLVLSACADTGPAQGPYSYTASNLRKDEYRIVLTGDPGVSDKELKKYFKVHGQKLCGSERVYLLRGLRDEYKTASRRHVMTGDIDCVELDYFDGEPAQKSSAKKPAKKSSKKSAR
jgi:hypothetical protein